MNYSPLEIALILGSCQTEEEVYEACYSFRHLIDHEGQEQKELMEHLACKRVKYLITKPF